MPEQGKRANVESAIRTRIASGEYAAGGNLPSLASLAADFQVNKETVRFALARLAAAGLVSLGQGRPARVVGTERIQLDANSDAITWANRIGNGADDVLVSAEREVAEGVVAAHLQVEPGTDIVRRVRHQTRGGRLAVVMTQWVTVETVERVHTATGQTLDDATNPPDDDLFTLLHRADLEPHETTEVTYARAATDAERETFGITDDTPILVTSRITTNAEGVPLEYATMPSHAGLVSIEGTFAINR